MSRLAAAALACLLALGADAPPAPPDAAAAVREAAERMGKAEGPVLWIEAERLAAAVPKGREAILAAIPGAPPRGKVGLARALSLLGEPRPAAAALGEVLGSGAPEGDRVLAAEALSQAGSPGGEEALKRLAGLAPPRLKLAAAAAVWETLREEAARDTLRGLGKSPDEALQRDAALALGRTGAVEEVRPLLEKIRREPGPRGDEAALLLDLAGLEARLDDRLPEPEADAPRLVEEVLKRVRENYVDESRIEPKRLAIAGARGIAESLDPFSSYLDEAEWQRFSEQMEGEYPGIGAYVGERREGESRAFVVISPIYPGPAYTAGIRSLDRILEVNGTALKGKSLEEVVRLLKGPAGTEVVLKIHRRGWRAAQTMRLARARVKVDSVLSGMLPGGLGYVRLLTFGQDTANELEKALGALEGKGIRALLLDLRDNPGGLLDAAVEVADKFLAKGKLVVYSQGRAGPDAARKNHYTKDEDTHPDYPLLVLVNHGSASASEIVAGALQDHRRGALVGEKTYGKGSVQRLLQLPKPYDKTRLRLTVAKYYLPSDRCIHEVGIEPDQFLYPEKTPMSAFEARESLRESEASEAWLEAQWKDHAKELMALAEDDGFDASRYPGLPDLKKDPKTQGLSDDDIRRVLRSFARKRAEDERGAVFACDLEEDTVLQKAVLEMMRRLGEDPAKMPQYAPLVARLQAAESREGATPDAPRPVPPGPPR